MNRQEIVAFSQSLLTLMDATTSVLINFAHQHVEIDEEPEPVIKIENYVERVIPGLNDQHFQEHFRLSRTIYFQLLHVLDRAMVNKIEIPIEKQVLSALWLLATPDSYRSIAERFNISKSSLHKSFVRVVTVLLAVAHQFIFWPNPDELRHNARQFKRIANIANVVGAIDGTFIPIPAPKNDSEVFRTRKSNYAFTFTFASRLEFINCFCGYPGSVHDARIFRNCGLYADVLQNQAKFFPDREMFIIGDKAYPVLDWCIPPYIDNERLNDDKRRFNHKLSQTRQVIERSFALLFGRFRRLKYLDMQKVELIPATIVACCVLHNICLKNNEGIDEYIREGAADVQGNDEMEVIEVGQLNELAGLGTEKRNNLCRNMQI